MKGLGNQTVWGSLRSIMHLNYVASPAFHRETLEEAGQLQIHGPGFPVPGAEVKPPVLYVLNGFGKIIASLAPLASRWSYLHRSRYKYLVEQNAGRSPIVTYRRDRSPARAQLMLRPFCKLRSKSDVTTLKLSYNVN